MITNIFTQGLYRPLFNALIALYNIIPGHDFGLAIIALTLILRAILFPLSIKSQRSQRALNALNPKVQEIKNRLKNDQAAQGAEIMKLYKDNNVSMVAGCLPMLIQLPILIALYRAFIAGLAVSSLSLLYPFIHNPGAINTLFLGFITITKSNKIMTVIAGALQFLQVRQSSQLMGSGAAAGAGNQMASMNKQMMYVLPVMIIVIGWNLPAGLILYWITTTLSSIFEQMYLKKTS